MKQKILHLVKDNLKTLLGALVIAVLIRSLLIQPFYIPSSSMEPTLLVGDRIFVSKYSYGYIKHSFQFSQNFSQNRFFFKKPKQGDLVVFKTPADNRTDYIKRLIGLPGDEIQFINGNLYINDKLVQREQIEVKDNKMWKFYFKTQTYIETLPNGTKHLATYNAEGTLQNIKIYCTDNHYFLMGDNRDCSKDSRYLSEVGYAELNLVGNAKIIFF